MAKYIKDQKTGKTAIVSGTDRQREIEAASADADQILKASVVEKNQSPSKAPAESESE